MAVNQLFMTMRRYGDLLSWFVRVVGALVAVAGWGSILWAWGSRGGFAWLSANAVPVWLVGLSCALGVVWFWTYRLRSRFQMGFRDTFRGDLRHNWDFDGEWRIPERGMLLVTGGQSGSGDWVDGAGITKVGAQWENYSFSFSARILSRCLGVVVRAQDLSNYYMFQIGPDHITPHRRVSVPVIEKANEAESGPPTVRQETALSQADAEDGGLSENQIGPAPEDGGVAALQETVGGDVVDLSGPSAAVEENQLDQAEAVDSGLTDERGGEEPASATVVQPIKFKVGWVIMPAVPLARSLSDWFDVRLSVRGQSARLYIDGELMLQKESFLAIPVGKVGFRNWGPEEAVVRDVRVRLDR